MLIRDIQGTTWSLGHEQNRQDRLLVHFGEGKMSSTRHASILQKTFRTGFKSTHQLSRRQPRMDFHHLKSIKNMPMMTMIAQDMHLTCCPALKVMYPLTKWMRWTHTLSIPR
jgi:hypothetical protein